MKSIVTKLLLSSLLVSDAQGSKCPELKCKDKEMGNSRVCFKHSGDDPVTEISLVECKDADKMCYLNYGEYAWVDSNVQFMPFGDGDG